MEDKNGAALDPYEGLPLYKPRQDDEHDWEHLDGQEYQPSPMIVPDTQIGFDADGNWHSVEHFTSEALGKAITPFRWAQYLQDALEQYCSTFDYTVGASEKDDIVQDIVSDRMERAATMEERLQLEDALQFWRKHYGN